MERQFIKRDTKNQKLIAGGALSPIVLDYIMDSEVPKPCRHFIGRDKELEELYTMGHLDRRQLPDLYRHPILLFFFHILIVKLDNKYTRYRRRAAGRTSPDIHLPEEHCCSGQAFL